MLTQNALPDDEVRRFAADVLRLTGARTSDRIGVAVSGGADSLALLLLAQAAFAGRVFAATVDHGLRETAAAEATFVAEVCAARTIPHATLRIAKLPPGNVSDAARTARYRALGSWADANALPWILTGHHADDQLETMIMRLNRASGVAGLAGIRARRGTVVRPLLQWRRSELAAIVERAGLVPVDDPSNRDDRFDRARLRKALADAAWLDPVAASRSAAALASVEAATEWSVAEIENNYVSECDGCVVFARNTFNFPGEYLRRITQRCLLRVDPACRPREDALQRLLATLEKRNVATVGGVMCRGGDDWTFRAAPLRRSQA